MPVKDRNYAVDAIRGWMMGVSLYSFEQNHRLDPVSAVYLSCAGFLLFVMMVLAKRPLDSLLLISVPLLLLGAVCPESRMAEKYNAGNQSQASRQIG